MRILWTRSFLNTISFVRARNSRALVGTTFGLSVLDIKSGKKVFSRSTWKRVQSADVHGDSYVIGLSFPGSIMWLDGKNLIWTYRTMGSVNSVLHFGAFVIAGTGFLTDIKGVRHVYISPYHAGDKWKEFKEKLRGVIYSISRDLSVRWRKEVRGIVSGMMEIERGLIATRLLYDRVAVLSSSSGEWVSMKSLGAPIRSFRADSQGMCAIIDNKLVMLSVPELEVVGEVPIADPIALACSRNAICVSEKRAIMCYDRESLEVIWRVSMNQNVRGIEILPKGDVLVITGKDRNGKIIHLGPNGETLEEVSTKGVPIYISAEGDTVLVGTLSRLIAIKVS